MMTNDDNIHFTSLTVVIETFKSEGINKDLQSPIKSQGNQIVAVKKLIVQEYPIII